LLAEDLKPGGMLNTACLSYLDGIICLFSMWALK